ncbi:MAG TPA: hypothetical protein VF832_09705 [Longimicrobiales bacterium]
MPRRSLSFLAFSLLALAACNPFHVGQAVQVSARDVNLNTRWHGNIASPAALAGVVQMTGEATMAPGSSEGNTTVTLSVANATPGGRHPWELHRGQCGDDQGVFGPSSAYKAIEIGGDGKATASARVPLETPTSGSYFVSVQASAANGETTVACGNLAPPTL